MKIKYRHVSEPDRVKIFDTETAYRNPGPLGPPCRDTSLEDYNAWELEHFAADKAKGVILDFEVISNAEAERLMNQKLFEFYKNRLVTECGGHGAFRFNAIEYMCRFPEIDPVEMAVALRKEGYVVVFDDSSISHGENVRKRKMVARAFAEAMKESSVDGLISHATAAAKEANQGKETVVKDFLKE